MHYVGNKFRVLDADGAPVNNAKINTYEAGGLTPKAAYTTRARTVEHENPIRTGPDGAVAVFLGDGITRVIVTDEDDVALPDGDVEIEGDPATDLANATDEDKGAALVGYSQENAYAGGTVGGRLLQDVSVLDLKYMTLAQIADVVSYTGALDVTACIQAALDDVSTTTWLGSGGATAYAKGGGKVYLPPGKWRITDTLRVGNSTELYGASAFGHTAVSITEHTGTLISCDFDTPKLWAISSATYETATGTFAPFNEKYTGVNHDAGAITLTYGIKLHDLTIDGNGAYGGVRLMASSGFDVQNVCVFDVGVGFHFNTCFGARYGNLRAIFSLYGLVISACTAMECGHLYADKSGDEWSDVAADTTTRLVGVFDTSTDAFLPDEWSDLTFGLYAENSVSMSFTAQTCEHADIGSHFAHVSDFSLTGYYEGNEEANCGFVASTGQMTVFANGTTSGTKYAFGTLNDVSMDGCSRGGIYVGESSNVVRVQGGDTIGDDTDDWSWSDSINFMDLGNVLRVSATGSSTAVLGYTTFAEALRRISASEQREWTIEVKDGDTVATAEQTALSNKNIAIRREGAGTKPLISVGAAGGGFIYRWALAGCCRLSLLNVDVDFPAVAAVGTDNALINSNGAVGLEFAAENVAVDQGNGYSMFGSYADSALNICATWSGCDITASTPAAILRSTGSAVVVSIQADSTLLAGIKAIGSNGWGGTVLNSNFP